MTTITTKSLVNTLFSLIKQVEKMGATRLDLNIIGENANNLYGLDKAIGGYATHIPATNLEQLKECLEEKGFTVKQAGNCLQVYWLSLGIAPNMFANWVVAILTNNLWANPALRDFEGINRPIATHFYEKTLKWATDCLPFFADIHHATEFFWQVFGKTPSFFNDRIDSIKKTIHLVETTLSDELIQDYKNLVATAIPYYGVNALGNVW